MRVKELADELQTSKTTIKNIIERLGITPGKAQKNGQWIIELTKEEADEIREEYRKKHTENTANHERTTENTTKKTAKANRKSTDNTTKQGENFAQTENTAKVESLENCIKILQSQLETKDRQIEKLLESLEKEQSLRLIADTKLLESLENQEQKKSFWSRIFKKKNADE